MKTAPGSSAGPRPFGRMPASALLERGNLLAILGVFAAALAVYVATCARSVTGEDAGELAAAAASSGIAHPPGYPLWTLLGRAATLLPGAEPAFAVALLSAFLGAAAAALAAALALLLSGSRIAAAGAALGFAFLRDQWFHAATVEVYTLHAALTAACILALLAWAENRSWRRLRTFALLYGLSLSNHHVAAGLAPLFLGFLLYHGWRLLPRWRPLAGASAMFLLGLLPYAYLPAAASRGPDINWGDPSTPARFAAHVSRAQYAGDAEGAAEGARRAPYPRQIAAIGSHFAEQGGAPLLLAGAAGTAWLALGSSAGLLLLAAALATTLGAAWAVDFPLDYENIYASRIIPMTAYLALVPGAAVLAARLAGRIPGRVRPAALGLAALAFAAPPLAANRDACDYSRYTLMEDHARRLLATPAPGAILFPSSDHGTFPLLYLRYALGVRPDICIGDKYGYPDPPLAALTPYGEYLDRHGRRGTVSRAHVEDWLIRNSGRPVYFSRKRPVRGEPAWEMVPEGLWYRARPAGEPLFVRREACDAARETLDSMPAPSAGAPGAPLDYTARAVLADEEFCRARRLLERKRREEGAELALEAAALLPDSKEMHNNLGSLLGEHGMAEEAAAMFGRAVGIDPGYLTGLRNLGVALASLGRTDGARSAFERVRLQAPRDPAALRGLAEIHRSARDWGPCARLLELLGRETGDAAALRDAGLIRLFEMNDLGNAKRLLQASLSIDPDQPEIREAERRIRPAGEREREEEDARRRERAASARASGPPGPGAQPRGGVPGRGPVPEPSPDLPDPASGARPSLPAGIGIPAPPGGGAPSGRPRTPSAPVPPQPGGGRP